VKLNFSHQPQQTEKCLAVHCDTWHSVPCAEFELSSCLLESTSMQMDVADTGIVA